MILPGGSVGKESACNVGDLGLTPGSGRSPGEGNGKGKRQCKSTERKTQRLSLIN